MQGSKETQQAQAKFFPLILLEDLQNFDNTDIEHDLIIPLLQLTRIKSQDQAKYQCTQMEEYFIDTFSQGQNSETTHPVEKKQGKSRVSQIKNKLLSNEIKLIRQKLSCLQQASFEEGDIKFEQQLKLLGMTPYDVKKILTNTQRLLLIYDVYLQATKSSYPQQWSQTCIKLNPHIIKLQELFTNQKKKLEQYGHAGEREKFLNKYVSIFNFPHLQSEFKSSEGNKDLYGKIINKQQNNIPSDMRFDEEKQ